jgi:hypothetical protein
MNVDLNEKIIDELRKWHDRSHANWTSTRELGLAHINLAHDRVARVINSVVVLLLSGWVLMLSAGLIETPGVLLWPCVLLLWTLLFVGVVQMLLIHSSEETLSYSKEYYFAEASCLSDSNKVSELPHKVSRVNKKFDFLLNSYSSLIWKFGVFTFALFIFSTASSVYQMASHIQPIKGVAVEVGDKKNGIR